ncbi:MAG: DUF3025 domain-containing protein [Rhodanobacter sp.]
MRYIAPKRELVDPLVFDRLPLAAWDDYAALLRGPTWPSVAAINRYLPAHAAQRFIAQTPALLADGLHYEQRIAEHGQIPTREGNWHDLLNALVWLRHPALKQALNQRQIAEIARVGPKQRSRAQYALTHFDEGGVIVLLRDAALLPLWDNHDWHGLFWHHRQAWVDGTIQAELFGHALLEQALTPEQLLVGKALVFQTTGALDMQAARTRCAELIAAGQLLHDPLELRPLPLSGLPGWNAANVDEAFHRSTVCYQPKRAGRRYPPPQVD